MQIQTTETFERTWDSYKLATNQKIIDANRLEIIKPIYRYDQIVSMGGSRSSKSYSILQLLLLEMVTRKNLKITVWRNLKNVCRTSVLEDFQNITMFDYKVYSKIKYNKQAGSFEYMPTKSRIVFEGADNIGKVLGGTQDISFFNEVSEFSKRVYLEITQRTAERVFCDYNPSKNFWLESYRNDPSTIFIHSTFLDNHFCPPNIIKRIKSYEPWETGSYEIKGTEIYYNGEPISPTNQPPPHVKNVERGTASEYMWLVYGLGIGAEKPNKIYKGWQKITNSVFEEQPHTSYFGMDFGASNPTACVEVKFDGDGAFYIRERFYSPLQDIDDTLPTVVKLRIPDIIPGESLIICDSAKQKYIDLLLDENYMALGAVKGGGSIEVGISLVQKFRIYYVPSDNLNFEYANYSWEVDRYGKSTDKPMATDDHLMDALRYIVSYLYKYLEIKL